MLIGRRGIAILTGMMVALAAASANAGPIRGSFSITGDFLPVYGATGELVVDQNGVPTFEGATGINFLNMAGTDPGHTGAFFVVNAFAKRGQPMDFSGLRWTAGTIRDFACGGGGSAHYPKVPILGFVALVLLGLTLEV